MFDCTCTLRFENGFDRACKSKVITLRIFVRQNSLEPYPRFSFLSDVFVLHNDFPLHLCRSKHRSIRASSGINKFNASIKLTLDSSSSKEQLG